MDVKVTGGDKLKEFTGSLLGIKFEQVKVGYFKTSRYPDGKQVAEIAVHHEFGAPNAKIPARPTMRPAVKKMNKEMPGRIKKLAEDHLQDPKLFARLVPEHIGLRCGGLIQKFIAMLLTPKLADSTLHRRRTRKINRTTSTKPLVDSGQLRLSVSYQVGNRQPRKIASTKKGA